VVLVAVVHSSSLEALHTLPARGQLGKVLLVEQSALMLAVVAVAVLLPLVAIA
jgi:hypothetical protein